MMTILYLIFVVGAIILATSKFKLHPFLTLVLAALIMGLLSGLDLNDIVGKVTTGFGNTLQNIGIVIACGTIIGTFLERSDGAKRMATSVLRLVGENKAPLAMSITGFIVSVPVFCDSGFVILSSLNKALSRRTGISLTILATALSTGLYATHVFVPPTPGPLAAAATIGADIGLLILFGLIVAIPSAIAGLLWAIYYTRRFSIVPFDEIQVASDQGKEPGALISLIPLVIPIILITLKSIADFPTSPFGQGFTRSLLDFLGHPMIALIIGVFLAFGLKKKNSSDTYLEWVSLGLKNAGVIILITGAGGAFGTVLQATDIGDTLGRLVTDWHIGIFLPFMIAAMFKSAQGSSTVAMITTAALIAPLMDSLGLVTPVAKVLTVLAISAGSMTISHVNDSYFWVVSQFSDMNTAIALRCHTIATLIQGIVGIVTISLLSMILL